MTFINKVRARCRVKVALRHTRVVLRMRTLVRHMHNVCAIHISRIVCIVTRSSSWCKWLGLSITVRVRVRVRARDGKWIFLVPFFFLLLKVTNTFVLAWSNMHCDVTDGKNDVSVT